MTKNRFLWLDLIRGISALVVVLDHLRSVLFGKIDPVHSADIGYNFFFSVTELGHQAVMVFFVLSGFLVGGAVIERLNNFSYSDYLFARLTRLWIVLIPALVWTFIVDKTIQIVDPRALEGYWFKVWELGPSPQSPWTNSLVAFLGNICFLQRIIVPIYGTNGPLWSLANEFWYYILFPLALVGLGFSRVHKGKASQWISLGLLIGIPLFLNYRILALMFVWLLGAAVYFSMRFKIRSSPSKFSKWISFLFFLASLYLSKKHCFATFAHDVLLGLSFSIWLRELVMDEKKSSFKRLDKVIFFISDISYSLYLFHFPVVLLIGGLVYKGAQYSLSAFSIAVYFSWTLILTLGGALFWYCFERRTQVIKKYITQAFSSK